MQIIYYFSWADMALLRDYYSTWLSSTSLPLRHFHTKIIFKNMVMIMPLTCKKKNKKWEEVVASQYRLNKPYSIFLPICRACSLLCSHVFLRRQTKIINILLKDLEFPYFEFLEFPCFLVSLAHDLKSSSSSSLSFH